MQLAAKHAGYFAVVPCEVQGPGSVGLLLCGKPRDFFVGEVWFDWRWRGGGTLKLVVLLKASASCSPFVSTITPYAASRVEVLCEPVQEKTQELLTREVGEQIDKKTKLRVVTTTKKWSPGEKDACLQDGTGG